MLKHFKNIKLIGETLFPWVWLDRGKMEENGKKKEEEKGKEKSVLAKVGSSPFCF